jgi:hypothetical protein
MEMGILLNAVFMGLVMTGVTKLVDPAIRTIENWADWPSISVSRVQNPIIFDYLWTYLRSLSSNAKHIEVTPDNTLQPYETGRAKFNPGKMFTIQYMKKTIQVELKQSEHDNKDMILIFSPWSKGDFQVVKNLFLDAEKKYVEDNKSKVLVYQFIERTWSTTISYPKNQKIFRSNDTEAVVARVFEWLRKKNLEKGDTSSIKILLTGKPGTGKSNTGCLLSRLSNYPIYNVVIDKHTTNDVIMTMFNSIPSHSVIVIEDINSISALEKDSTQDSDHSFSVFYNLLDGPIAKQDCIIVLMCNYPEMLKEAFLRDQRITYRKEIRPLDANQILAYLSFFFKNEIISAELSGQLSSELRNVLGTRTITIATVTSLLSPFKGRSLSNCVPELLSKFRDVLAQRNQADDVADPGFDAFLTSLGLQKYIQVFIEHDIRSEKDFLMIEEDQIDTLNLPIGSRNRLSSYIKSKSSED